MYLAPPALFLSPTPVLSLSPSHISTPSLSLSRLPSPPFASPALVLGLALELLRALPLSLCEVLFPLRAGGPGGNHLAAPASSGVHAGEPSTYTTRGNVVGFGCTQPCMSNIITMLYYTVGLGLIYLSI
jgi:hypothetical protein